MEVSNKTLAYLVIAAVVVSLTGTLLSLNGNISGYAVNNDTGYANITITSTTSIKFAVSQLDFGSGYVNNNASGMQCNLSINKSLGTNVGRSGTCVNFNSVIPANSWLTLENNGNTVMNVTLNFSHNAANLIPTISQIPELYFTVSENESNSCTGINSALGAWTPVVNNTAISICNGTALTGLLPNETADSLALGIKLVIPSDAMEGNKSLSIRAEGRS